MLLAALSAIIALTVLSGHAAAGSRFEERFLRGGYVEVDDRGGYRQGGRSARYEDVMPERDIVRSLIRRGFVSVEEVRLRRDRYIVEAVRPNGALIRLVIDAYDGEIIGRERIGWVRDRGGRGPRGGWGGNGIELDLGGGSLGIYSR